jgi:hypothetical protein
MTAQVHQRSALVVQLELTRLTARAFSQAAVNELFNRDLSERSRLSARQLREVEKGSPLSVAPM